MQISRLPWIMSMASIIYLNLCPQRAASQAASGAQAAEERLTALPVDSAEKSRELSADDEFARLSEALDAESGLPKAFSLAQNCPNPFNPATTISYSIASGAEATPVTLEVFDSRGRRVRTLVNEVHEPGQYAYFWQGTDRHGRQLGSGVYFYRLRAGKFTATRKMVILK